MRYIAYIESKKLNVNLWSDKIEEWIIDSKCTTMFLDPIQQFFVGQDPHGKDMDMNDSSSVRPVLTHLWELAKKHNIGIVIQCHANKNVTMDALQSTMGSNDFTAQPRSCIYMGLNPFDKEERIVTVSKANSVPDKHKKSFGWKFGEHGNIIIGKESDLQSNDVMPTKHKVQNPEELENNKSKLERAKEHITIMLDGWGYMFLSDIIERGKNLETPVSRDTIYIAKKSMHHIKSGKRDKKGYWCYDGGEPPMTGYQLVRTTTNGKCETIVD
jgi:hypothetical protein